MTTTVLTFTSSLSTNTVAVPATGCWFAMDRSVCTGRSVLEVEAFTNKWVPLSGIDGEGKPFVYELTHQKPTVWIPGPVDALKVRVNALNSKGTTTNAFTQYT